MIVDQEINFDLNYNITYKDGFLTFNKVDNPLLNYYGRNISNITAIVGKNGSGKTSLLDAIGMTYYDRNNAQKTDSYFIMYKNEENYYLEFQNARTHEKIKNLQINLNFYKDCLGFEVELKNNIFITKNYLSWKGKNDFVKYYYYQNGYNSSRISRDRGDDREYFFERHYIKGISELEKYLLIIDDIDFGNNGILQISGCDLVVQFKYNDIDVHDSKYTGIRDFEEYLRKFKKELSFIDIDIFATDGNNEPKYSLKEYIEHYLSCIILSSLDYYLELDIKEQKAMNEIRTNEGGD